MYNYSLQLCYRNDSQDTPYRDEMLQAFNIETYDEDVINSTIDLEIIPLVEDHFNPIYDTMNKYNQFPFPLDKLTCIKLLFSWEYFYLFHQCIGEIKREEIKDSIVNLLNVLNKTGKKANKM